VAPFVLKKWIATVTLLPSGTSVEFISSSISIYVSLTVSLGNDSEVMTAVTAVTSEVIGFIKFPLPIYPRPVVLLTLA
jgi:hypothetical protein